MLHYVLHIYGLQNLVEHDSHFFLLLSWFNLYYRVWRGRDWLLAYSRCTCIRIVIIIHVHSRLDKWRIQICKLHTCNTWLSSTNLSSYEYVGWWNWNTERSRIERVALDIVRCEARYVCVLVFPRHDTWPFTWYVGARRRKERNVKDWKFIKSLTWR